MQSSEWEGRVGDVWAEEWQRTDRSFGTLAGELVSAAAECVAGDTAPRVLDVGCGAGTTSLSLSSRLPAAQITGIDLSAALVDIARDRGADNRRCRFEVGDASRWSDETGFDLLVSRHGVMFFEDQAAAFTHLRSLARPGGNIVFSCFQSAALNLWASGLAHLMPRPGGDPRAPGPFAFADEAYVAAILAQSGWRDASVVPSPFDYVAGGGSDPVTDAIDYLGRIGPIARALRDLDEPQRAQLREALRAFVDQHHDGERVAFPAAAWIWRARA